MPVSSLSALHILRLLFCLWSLSVSLSNHSNLVQHYNNIANQQQRQQCRNPNSTFPLRRSDDMGREFPTAEDDFELSLELSIGGCYAKSERETTAPSEGEDGGREIPRSDFSCEKPEIEGAAENGCDFSDLQRRREMQAMKRREARMKREFKKSRGMSGCRSTGATAAALAPQPKRRRHQLHSRPTAVQE